MFIDYNTQNFYTNTKFSYTYEVLAKVSNVHPPQPLPSPASLPGHASLSGAGREAGRAREGLDNKPSPLVAYGSEPTAQRGEGKGEG